MLFVFVVGCSTCNMVTKTMYVSQLNVCMWECRTDWTNDPQCSMVIPLRTYVMFVKRCTHSHNVYDYWAAAAADRLIHIDPYLHIICILTLMYCGLRIHWTRWKFSIESRNYTHAHIGIWFKPILQANGKEIEWHSKIVMNQQIVDLVGSWKFIIQIHCFERNACIN